MDKYRSKCKTTRRRFHGYKPEKVTTTTTRSESMHMQDGEEPDLPLSSVRKTEKECVVKMSKIVPIAANSNSSQVFLVLFHVK